jgi:predicted  nucleic acid-binding Zn-ribbon protein
MSSSRGRDLLALQEQDERVARLRREIAGIEAALRGDEVLERLRGEARDAEASRRSTELASRSVERDLAALRSRARTLEKRLYDGSVRNPQELLGMQRDLEALKPRLDELEGHLLEAMEAAEGAEAQLAQSRAAVAAREEEVQALEEPRRRRLVAARAELEAAEAERRDLAGGLPAADLALYQRVAAHHQPAVVRLEGDNCSGCHLPLSVREVSEARHGEGLVQCSRCDRVVTR